MTRRTDRRYKKHWYTLIALHGETCVYCYMQTATTIDHVIPYSYDQDNSIENLVPACAICNCIAGDKHFDDFEQKRHYIMVKQSRRRKKLAICIQCRLPYAYREHSPSLFLCAECHDEQEGTKRSKRKCWADWIEALEGVGIPVQLHREVKEFLEHKINKHPQKSFYLELNERMYGEKEKKK